METRAIPAPPVAYAFGMRAAWHGEYRLAAFEPWSKAAGQYGPIVYSTPEHALAGAAFCAAQESVECFV